MGGLHDYRLQKDASQPEGTKVDSTINVGEYLEHMSKLSEPMVHHPLFCLMLFNMRIRLKILRHSCLQLKSNEVASNLANTLTANDLDAAVRMRRGGVNGGTRAARKLLDLVKNTSRALPHTDEAARSAREDALSMQHWFGPASWFLTVTFEDECSLLMQALSGEVIDTEATSSSASTDDALSELGRRRKQLRLRFPGLAAVHYQMLKDVLLEVVVGWDMRKGQPTAEPGLFGPPTAVSCSTEEQGRGTAHVHILIWESLVQKWMQVAMEGNAREKLQAKKWLQQEIERLVSTKLFGQITPLNRRLLQRAFDHEGCGEPDLSKRSLPVVVNQQQLRHLRHRDGFDAEGGMYAYCLHCLKRWTHEELVEDRIKLSTPGLSAFPDNGGARRLHAEVVQYQMGAVVAPTEEQGVMIDASWNCHRSCHTQGCFRKSSTNSGKRRKTSQSLRNCECRYRLPDLPRRSAIVEESSIATNWIDWRGNSTDRPIIASHPRRGPYDCFQNQSCAAVSRSKLACNSNLAMVNAGPVLLYIVKYHTKGTQKEDAAEFEEVRTRLKQVLSQDNRGRRYETDRAEAVRLACRSVFA